MLQRILSYLARLPVISHIDVWYRQWCDRMAERIVLNIERAEKAAAHRKLKEELREKKNFLA